VAVLGVGRTAEVMGCEAGARRLLVARTETPANCLPCTLLDKPPRCWRAVWCRLQVTAAVVTTGSICPGMNDGQCAAWFEGSVATARRGSQHLGCSTRASQVGGHQLLAARWPSRCAPRGALPRGLPLVLADASKCRSAAPAPHLPRIAVDWQSCPRWCSDWRRMAYPMARCGQQRVEPGL
jgi:hypothetical protein